MKEIRLFVPAAVTAAFLALAACSDSPVAPDPAAADTDAATLVAPDAPRPIPEGSVVVIHDVIEDVIHRVLPALDSGGSTAALAAGLRRVLAGLEVRDAESVQRALSEVDRALDRYQLHTGEELAPDIGAIRLALEALEAY